MRPAGDPSAVDQTRIVLSVDAEYKLVPSCENRRLVTAAVCPERVNRVSPVAMSHSLIELSAVPVAAAFRSGLIATAVTLAATSVNFRRCTSRG